MFILKTRTTISQYSDTVVLDSKLSTCMKAFERRIDDKKGQFERRLDDKKKVNLNKNRI